MGIYCDPLIESQNEVGLGPHLLEFSQKNELVVGSSSATLHDPPMRINDAFMGGDKALIATFNAPSISPHSPPRHVANLQSDTISFTSQPPLDVCSPSPLSFGPNSPKHVQPSFSYADI